MRTIKFRAWDKESCEYRPWDDILSLRYNERWFKDVIGEEYINCIFTDASLIMEEFTGLYDADHVEVYEGDIIQSTRFPDDDKDNSMVVLEDGAFCKTWSEPYLNLRKPRITQSEINEWKIKVIGNINENPELLEV